MAHNRVDGITVAELLSYYYFIIIMCVCLVVRRQWIIPVSGYLLKKGYMSLVVLRKTREDDE